MCAYMHGSFSHSPINDDQEERCNGKLCSTILHHYGKVKKQIIEEREGTQRTAWAYQDCLLE